MGAADHTQVLKAVADQGMPGSPGSGKAVREGKRLEGQWHKWVWREGVFTPTPDSEAQGRRE